MGRRQLFDKPQLLFYITTHIELPEITPPLNFRNNIKKALDTD